MASNPSPPDDLQQKPKGKHVTTACQNCRRRKIKCDGVVPRCSNCVLYDQTCVYQHGLDKRKIAPKERLQALTAYCQELESLLRLNGIALPSPPSSHVQGHPDLDASVNSFQVSSHVTDPIEPKLERGPSDGVWQQSLDTSADAPSYDDVHPSYESSPDQDVNDPSGGNQESEALMDQLSGRIGSLQIAEDGQLRFYGATSNLHILHNGPMSLSRSNFRSTCEDGAALLQSGGVGHLVSEELEDHLLQLYLCWEDPSIHVIDEDIFWRERRNCKATNTISSMYSEVLTNAMCSIGATLTSRQILDLPEDLPDFFATRSKLLLELEMDAPTVSTVQSLVILSAIEALLTRDARGWLNSGMAVRLAVDLGLHLDPQPYVQIGLLDEEEAMLRKMVWGGVFIHDRMWSLYVGRPVGIDDKNITVSFSSLQPKSTDVQKWWSPYIDDSQGLDVPRMVNPIEELTIWNVKLCANMTVIREILYPDGLMNPKSTRQLFDFANTMRLTLNKWQSDLPLCLRVNEDDSNTVYLPHVLQLHMQYHCVVIVTSRPFFASSKKLVGLLPQEIAVHRNSCTSSANSVARLIQIYRRLYGLRRINVQAVHLIFTAALVHVFMACGAQDATRSNTAWKNLESCCQALAEVGVAYKSSTRALEVIMGLKADLLRRSSSARTKRKKTWNDRRTYSSSSAAKKRKPSHSEEEFVRGGSASTDTSLSTFDPGMSETGQAFNFFDSNLDDFALDNLFWAGFNNLDMPNFPPNNPTDNGTDQSNF
ncbi:hypothetical protein B0A52_01128 [Exophiala mesophila]|uniref:Zn(2)-C6 fungal-type domain-containing protein n=1 Tax=Exophiala mesophila TaxID=212818 RepID=A0A438NGK0_EXOME|nr:hypothetical protein B0A52_01128 [Exophiala mesophila]